jgi:hypothetical protein
MVPGAKAWAEELFAGFTARMGNTEQKDKTDPYRIGPWKVIGKLKVNKTIEENKI